MDANVNQRIRLIEKNKVFTPSVDDGKFTIAGTAAPNKKITLKSIGDNEFQHEKTTTNKKGNFSFDMFYSGTIDEKCWISYTDRKLTNYGIKITIKSNENFKDSQASSSSSQPSTSPAQDESDSDESKESNSTSKPKATSEDKAALRKAVDYSDTFNLSKQGII